MCDCHIQGSVILKQILKKLGWQIAEQIQLDLDDPTVGSWQQGNALSWPTKAGNFKAS